jgi:hypothetical protein
MRPNPILPLRLAAACFLLFLSASSAKAQCGVNTVGFGDVGIVSGNPFHAEVVVTRPGSTEMASTIAPRFPELVARDSQGRVRTEKITGPYRHDNGAEEGTIADRHLVMICDPIAQTLTRIDTLDATAEIIHSRPSAPNSPRPQSAPARTFCSSRLFLNHAGQMRGEDLGVQTIQGVEAHGERISLPMLSATGGEPPHSDTTTERWCSDQLSAVVLTVTENTKAGAKSTLAMQNIERTEPDPALFQIPSGYAITESVADPALHYNPRAPAPQPPTSQP